MSSSASNLLLPLRTIGIELVAEVSIPQPVPTSVLPLTRGLAANDEEAFREFHQLYFDRLYHFMLAVTRGQEDEAQEALQETLLRVLRYARPFETEDAFWSWLKVVARSTARDRGRKQQRYLKLLQSFALRGQYQVEVQTFDEEDHLRGLLDESLGELDPQDRQLVEGKYLGEATVRELSARTGLTDKAVESRLLRARRDLRQRLLQKLRSL